MWNNRESEESGCRWKKKNDNHTDAVISVSLKCSTSKFSCHLSLLGGFVAYSALSKAIFYIANLRAKKAFLRGLSMGACSIRKKQTNCNEVGHERVRPSNLK
ncbi:hypothetical protein CEXT_6491 [Caerostris extrusa]|uniref:Uncharacterized protein n=1 Tax=Caerostris extrusa TaxID=172846 RepID=A0AAV4U4Q7_CAEEX|nr:hypothetical protein CEXT_6491 [Caerostris extrusa]